MTIENKGSFLTDAIIYNSPFILISYSENMILGKKKSYLIWAVSYWFQTVIAKGLTTKNVWYEVRYGADVYDAFNCFNPYSFFRRRIIVASG